MSLAIQSVQLTELERAEQNELRSLMRLAFYASLNRRAPQRLVSVPSYVRAVRKHFDLTSGNQARQYLAQVEGFTSWNQLMAAMLKEGLVLS